MEFYIKKTLELARKIGAHNLTRETLAGHFGISAGSFTYSMGVPYSEFMNQVAKRIPLEELAHGSRVRMLPSFRKRQVLAHAIALAREHFYFRLTAQQVADAAGISKANLARLYTLPKLREAIVTWAVENDDPVIIAQARTAGDPLIAEEARHAPDFRRNAI